MQTHPLKTSRELRGWSQSRVADQIGVSIRTIVRWEQGLTLPYPYYREQLCALFHMDASSLGLLPHPDTSEQATILPDASHLAPSQPSSPATRGVFDPMIPEALGQAKHLLGRDSLLAQIKQQLLTDKLLALTALQGLPGIGKTALAITLISDPEVQAYFSDGILWAGLGPQPEILSILVRWSSLLGLKGTDLEDPTKQSVWAQALQTTIGSRRMLLVLDDAWEVQKALTLQVGGPFCTYLLTTRLPDVAFTFSQKNTIVVTELEETDGLALLARYVPQLVQEEPETSLELVRSVGALPLAINLLGKFLAAQAYTGQPRRVQSALTRLRDRQQRLSLEQPMNLGTYSPTLTTAYTISLQATIAVSVQQLNAEEQATLAALALFPPKPNSFSEEGALAVSASSVETLDSLWDNGLLESSGPDRYSLHQTIADYAHTPEIMLAQDNNIRAKQRFVSYTVTYIEAHKELYNALEQEVHNILTALDTAEELAMWEPIFTGVIAVVPFMRVRGLYRPANHYLQKGLQAAIALGDPGKQVTALAHLAAFAELRGDYAQAEDYGQQGLTLARESGQKEAIGALLTTLSQVAFDRGDNDLATSYCEEGLQLTRASGDQERTCLLLNNLGRVAHAQGNYHQAEAFYHESLVLARQIGHQEIISRQLTALGGIAIERSDYAQAEQYSLEGLSLARQLGYHDIIGYLLNNMGVISYLLGNIEQGEAYSQEGLALARQIGNRGQICRHLANLGRIAIIKGDINAEAYLQEAIDLARQLGNNESLPLLLMNLGEALTKTKNFDRANAAFQESVAVGRQQKAWWAVSYALMAWGELYLTFLLPEAANEVYQEVLLLTQKTVQARDVAARAKYGQARVEALRKNFEHARLLGEESLKELETIGHYKAHEVRHWLKSLPKP